MQEWDDSTAEADAPFVLIIFDGTTHEMTELERGHHATLDSLDRQSNDALADRDYTESVGPDGKRIDSFAWLFLEVD